MGTGDAANGICTAIRELPTGDADDSLCWRRIKKEFTRRYLGQGGEEGARSASRRWSKERDVWQRRFWEHTIADEDDLENHLDSIHDNPVKHGLVASPRDEKTAEE